jgi:hypothetical protein
MIAGNDDSSFRNLSVAVPARLTYGRLELTRSCVLPFGLQWVVHGSGQMADTRLPPNEQINAGGPGGVPGYPAYALRGDASVLLSNELRLTELHSFWPIGQTLDLRLILYMLIDDGALHAPDKTSALDGTLTSFGTGARAGLSRHVDLVLAPGAQLRIGSVPRYPGQFFDIGVMVRHWSGGECYDLNREFGRCRVYRECTAWLPSHWAHRMQNRNLQE